MANLSKIKREKMLDYLEKLKNLNNDDENIHTITEIENALNEKKYGLVWEEHSEKVDDMLEHNIPIFVEDEKRKIIANEDDPYNFLLEGDNLHSLKLLEKTHKGKIDVIYIDPPYNTGNKDFIYDDSFVDKTDGYAHSKWLSFIEKRLIIARELLSDAGVIFISIDDNEQAQLKLLCDEIFGETNFINNVIWHKKHTRSNDAKWFSDNHDFVVVCAKYKQKWSPNLLPRTEESLKGYKNPDNDIRGVWASGPCHVKTPNEKDIYPVVTPSGKTCMPPDGTSWRFSEEKMKDLIADNRIYFGKNGSNVPRYKRFLTEVQNGFVPTTIWFRDEVGDTQEGNSDMKKVFEERAPFSNPKPLRLIERCLRLSTNKKAIVLDFFAGSGTTGQAVMELNKEDSGHRKYILCTNNENNICEEVTYQRLKNIQEDLPHNLKYYTTEFIPKFSDEDESVSDKMMVHIKELIELEDHIELDGKRYIILEDEDKLVEAIEKIANGGSLFVRSGIFLSRSDQRKLDEKQVNISEIPEYYFRDELKEVGEL